LVENLYEICGGEENTERDKNSDEPQQRASPGDSERVGKGGEEIQIAIVHCACSDVR
jgi:hypothetical protein